MYQWVAQRDWARGDAHAAALALAVACAFLLALLPAPALAAPTDVTDDALTTAQSEQNAAAAEVGRLSALVSAAEADLERAGVVVEAANEGYRVAQGELEEAESAAAAASVALHAAEEAVRVAQADVEELGRASYMRSDSINGLAALLDADGPAELLEQAATLRLLGDQRTATLDQLRVAQALQAAAEAQARAAVADKDAAAQEAAQAKSAAESQLATFQTSVETASAQKAAYQQQLQHAEINLLTLQGQRNAYQAWREQQARAQAGEAAEAAAAAKAVAEAAARARQAPVSPPPSETVARPPATSAVGVPPTSGRFTTCFEMRWETMHNGVDIAAPTGTPIYAPAAGRVVRAGTATGYGLAVYIRHDDGSVSVYGHINDYFVAAGQRVSAGQVIAEVGNRGESTGPHLHFQINTDGLHAGAVNPIPWLAARGVSMSGRCR
jgi:murein DD-endopeptidase MepM/ murein hydrolase activator NlpD